MTNAIGIALSGLQAAAKRVNAVASNIANLQTVGSLTPGGQAPYTPLEVQQTAQANGGVASDYAPRNPAFVPAYDADSPFADENGVIGVPNVDLATEAVNLNLAELTYKANLKTIEAARDLDKELLSIFDRKV